MRWWELLWRSVFEIDHAGHRYACDVDLLDFDEKIHFYENGRRVQTQEAPARFDVPGGVIEVGVSMYGVNRAHLVLSSGDEQIMTPAPGTAERWRWDLARHRPTLSAVIGWTAWTILVIALMLQFLQLAEWGLPRFGFDFTSPISLPVWLNTTLSIAGILAAIDRALQLKNHWLLDSDFL